MRKITESEARQLLSEPRICPDHSEWAPSGGPKGSYESTTGLVDLRGLRTGLFAKMIFYRSPITRLSTAKFSVFQLDSKGSSRVYQLDLRRHPKSAKDWHSKSHEHIGDVRLEATDDWKNWTFEDTLKYFCTQANITFDPNLKDPEHFELRLS